MVTKIRVFTSILLMMIISSGCLKDNSCDPKSVESEEAAIQAYATANSINAVRHSSGMYYQIVNPGSGPTPTVNSVVSARYVGKLTDGTIFDSQTVNPVSFPLGNTILGWQLGIPLVQKGGTIKLIIPSSLGYGCTGQGPIPGNSILYFEVNVVDVQF
jgi:FKBP-type peptidyl-prolyl cis-trans isomerase FkpA